MAIACLRLVTFLPLRPDLSFPFFISFISVSTFFPEDGEYLRLEDFFEADFFVLLDFFFAAFLVAVDSLLENQLAWRWSKLHACSSGVDATSRFSKRGTTQFGGRPGCERGDRLQARWRGMPVLR
jgi:hypothetical protein